MSQPTGTATPPSSSQRTDADLTRIVDLTIRLGALFFIVGWCLWILRPFVGLVVWALVIAIALDSPFEKLSNALSGRRTLAGAAFVVIALAALIVPAVLLTESMIAGAHDFAGNLGTQGIAVPPPPDKVADWPIIGERVHGMWLQASENLGVALSRLEPQLKAVSAWLLRAAGSAGIGMLELAASLVIAGIMLVRTESRGIWVDRLSSRVAGERGPEMASLAQSSVQSVVQGIVGVAVIQSVLAGLGFILAGLPAAGLWALLVLIAAVIQLPVVLVMVAPMVMVYSAASPGVAAVFIVWSLVVAFLDNVLKPILFGRGARVPTLVIFLGAIGGMLSMGIIGLFLGAVVLTLGYDLFRAWIADVEAAPEVTA